VFVECKELILKPHTKFELKPSKPKRRRRRGESLPGKPDGTGFAKPVGQCAFSTAHALVQRFWRFF
jgi:hypothetical protein